MGNSFSSNTRKYKLLIGDLSGSDVSFEERKLFSLSEQVIYNEQATIGKLSVDLNAVVIDRHNILAQETSVESAVRKDSDPITLFKLLISGKPYYISQTFSMWNSYFTYDQLFTLCCHGKKTAIYLQPLGYFPNFISDFKVNLKHYDGSYNFFDLLQKFLEAFFDGMHIKLLPNVNEYEAKWKIKTRFHNKTGSKQAYVRDFFPKLRKAKPADGHCILGLTWTDLYPTEKLNFVLGEAHFTYKSGMFCFGRNEPKSYDPDTFKDIGEIDANIMWRIIKVVSHETCHLFGLMHCWYFHCAMNESSSMAEAASQPLFLCPVCLRKLQKACGFNILNRYRRMLCILSDISDTFPSPEFCHSVQWLKKCLEFLESESL
ncbi:archaemetzincin-2-like [Dreissena polymorpha]|uniref:Archaemetzincin-2 n=1 Tax=Dreissena polymorpha TaxID=45954 RepID=A0A9D4MY14_DREPO|nr:archaemetzincin-2-like [Dreissena polymorpha]KAH3886023.1 hypothetical protein DPMN_010024 [Dreissena polymorpha]